MDREGYATGGNEIQSARRDPELMPKDLDPGLVREQIKMELSTHLEQAQHHLALAIQWAGTGRDTSDSGLAALNEAIGLVGEFHQKEKR